MLTSGKYDFCISFGACCAGAMQLKRRNLRLASMPFDWVRGGSHEQFVGTMATLLETNFDGWCLYENLEPVEKGKFDYPIIDPMEVTVWDRRHDMGFFHDFRYNIFAPDGRPYYEGIYERYRRRIDRLYEFLGKAESVFGILIAPEGPFAKESVVAFKRRLDALRPNVRFTLANVTFQAPERKVEEDRENGILYVDLDRKTHPYDFGHTSFEWSFLDEVKLTGRIAPAKEGKGKVTASTGMPFWYRLHRRLYMHCKKVLARYNAR